MPVLRVTSVKNFYFNDLKEVRDLSQKQAEVTVNDNWPVFQHSSFLRICTDFLITFTCMDVKHLHCSCIVDAEQTQRSFVFHLKSGKLASFF